MPDVYIIIDELGETVVNEEYVNSTGWYVFKGCLPRDGTLYHYYGLE